MDAGAAEIGVYQQCPFALLGVRDREVDRCGGLAFTRAGARDQNRFQAGVEITEQDCVPECSDRFSITGDRAVVAVLVLPVSRLWLDDGSR